MLSSETVIPATCLLSLTPTITFPPLVFEKATILSITSLPKEVLNSMLSPSPCLIICKIPFLSMNDVHYDNDEGFRLQVLSRVTCHDFPPKFFSQNFFPNTIPTPTMIPKKPISNSTFFVLGTLSSVAAVAGSSTLMTGTFFTASRVT